MRTRIPKKFNKIIAKMKIDTSEDKAGDIVHVTKDDNGYHTHNLRTGKTAFMFASMLRNNEVVEILQVEGKEKFELGE